MIIENTFYGLVLDLTSQNNFVYLNYFIDNNIDGTSQGYDGTNWSNLWYNEDTKKGNYWSDWKKIPSFPIPPPNLPPPPPPPPPGPPDDIPPPDIPPPPPPPPPVGKPGYPIDGPYNVMDIYPLKIKK